MEIWAKNRKLEKYLAGPTASIMGNKSIICVTDQLAEYSHYV